MLIPAVVKSTFGLTTAVAPAVAGAELPMKAAATPTPTTTKTHGITIPTIAPAYNPLLLLCLDTGNVEFVCGSLGSTYSSDVSDVSVSSFNKRKNLSGIFFFWSESEKEQGIKIKKYNNNVYMIKLDFMKLFF